MRKAIRLTALILLLLTGAVSMPAQDTARLAKTLNVAQGLPQSFISGLVQDAQGFVWIGTRDGLARYDGRKFKVFNHAPDDTATLAANIISNLYHDRRGRLWILYESGEIDLLNTATGALLHLTRQPAYKAAYAALKGHSLIVRSFGEDAQGNVWMPGRQGGIFIFNTDRGYLRFYSDSALGLQGNALFGLNSWGGEMLLVTDTALISMDAGRRIMHVMPYHFDTSYLHSKRSWKDAYPVIRKNGELVVLDEQRLIIFQPRSGLFKTVALPARKLYLGPNILLDEKDNIFFDFAGTIYRLSADNTLTVWRSKIGRFPESQCMIMDKSGMLWVGGNGTGIQLYDQRLTHLWGQTYQAGFVKDVLVREGGFTMEELNSGFVKDLDPYLMRWVKGKNGKIWLSGAGRDKFSGNICMLASGHLNYAPWHIQTKGPGRVSELKNINALAFSCSGRLWGLDFYFHPVYLDVDNHNAIAYSPITDANGVNSMVIDGEDVFWISSLANGLFRYDRSKQELRQYKPDSNGKGFPSSQTSMLLQDPADSNMLWIGTLGSGLLHFDKRTGQYRSYTTKNGLPNNTVYTILADASGKLWGSTNKGIFRFDTQTGNIYNLTSWDGLPSDEFNRFHFLSLPDGRMAFGGVDGYIVFDPLGVSEDDFNPDVALTDIYINNAGADFGMPGSPLQQSINNIERIELPYQSNFLTFEFAALEYNVPEKLRYRYMLEGLNQQWIDASHNNTAVYTMLPPGSYTLAVNATNTAGKWGSKVKRLTIIIHPPFWKTWWFMLLFSLTAAGIVYLIIHSRLTAIRNKGKQQLQYERKAMELEAQALRAQMNPHFIFNCLNSIKCLIREDRKEESVAYLTTFSKLIRNQLSCTQKEVSLHAELETCRLYLQLEALRFGNKITAEFIIADNVDPHAVMVPPLIIQPFIENAIWHGILPLDQGGKVIISITGERGIVKCLIEDNGIGREISQLNKSKSLPAHQSKGMQLITDRLRLHSHITNRGGWMEIIDKKDGQGIATGTCIIIYLRPES